MPRVMRRKKAKKFGKKFGHFEDLPPELRMMIVDDMDPADRCRFARSSKSSQEEAKNSRKYIYSLELYGEHRDNIKIYVVHGEYRYNIDTGYFLNFCKEHGKYYMKYLNSDSEELWKNELDSSSQQFDLYQYAGNYFEKLLQLYQNKIRKLKIKTFSKQFDITSMTNLDILKLKKYVESSHIISKLRRPLNTLEISETETDQIVTNYEISKVENAFHIPDIKLNYQQFCELQAKNIRVNIGTLTELDIIDFLRKWQNGTSWKELDLCEWSLEGSKFNRKTFLDYLGRYEEGFVYVDLGLNVRRRRGGLGCSDAHLFFNSNPI